MNFRASNMMESSLPGEENFWEKKDCMKNLQKRETALARWEYAIYEKDCINRNLQPPFR